MSQEINPMALANEMTALFAKPTKLAEITDRRAELEAKPEIVQRTEKLYVDAYRVNGRELFSGTHDTVAPKWQYEGDVIDKSQLRDYVYTAFPHEVTKEKLVRPNGAETSHFGLFYGEEELPKTFKANYTPHTRENIADTIGATMEAWGQDSVKVSTTFDRGHLLCIAPTDSYRRSVFGSANNADNVNPRLIIQASLDGKAWKSTMGWYRDVCNNLTWLASVAVATDTIRHSLLFSDRHADLVAKLEKISSSWEQTVEYLQAMEARKLETAAVLLKLYGERPEEGRGKTTYDQKIAAILDIVRDERVKLEKPNRDIEQVTAWELYNAIQGHCQHAKTRHNSEHFGYMEKVAKCATDTEVLKAERVLFADELQPGLAV